jgi:citrate lyase subunit beta/citryl-CoA lyase
MIRSVLFVPSDSEKKLARASSCGADVVVLDLEDSVLPERKPLARQMTASYLRAAPDRSRLWVRINDLASGELLKDLAKVVSAAPAGIVLPKIRGPEDVRTVGCHLDALEVAFDVPSGSIRLLVLVTETPSAILRLGELVRERPDPRIVGLMWGAEDLSSALGAGDPRTTEGAWRPTYVHARTECLLASHALGVEAIDTVYVNYRDPEGLRTSCQSARYDGFTGRVAIHPDQVPIINEAFSPTAAEVALARRVVEAFAGGSGAVSLDGKMYDIPHLKAARRLLAAAGATA